MRLEDLVQTNLGRYQIEALIGQGGMAAVYRAFDPALQRNVALKVLYPQYLKDTDLVERFRGEAITAARLDHPNIAPIYDVGEAGGLVYLALKLLPGPSLADLLQREGRLPPAQVLQVAADIGAALDEAHRQGVVHRDIKPGNVLFDREQRAVLTDFGIAKSLDAPGLTESSVIVGTPDYIAPEQIDLRLAPDGCIDGRADVYAFGALLYRCLTGRRPFEGSAQMGQQAHLRDEPPAPSAVVPGLPPAVDAVIRAAMATEPAARTGHAGEVVESLRSALADVTEVGAVFPPVALRQEPHVRPTTAVPVSAPAVEAPPATLPPVAVAAVAPGRRRRLVAACLVAALMIALGSTYAFGIGGHRSPALADAAAAATSPPAPSTSATGTPIRQTPTATMQPTETVATTTVATSAMPAAGITAPIVLPTATLVSTADRTTARPFVPVAAPTIAVPPTSEAQSTTRVRPTPSPTTRPALPLLTAVPPTAVPPTAVPPTAVPSTVTTGAVCKPLLTGGFGHLWNTNKELRRALGCALDVEIAAPAAEQLFTGGLMYWLSATQRIYVLTPGGAGSWSSYANTDQDGEQLTLLTLPPGCIAPVRGFGKLWRNVQPVSDALGCGLTPEAALSGATSGVYQRFTGGTMLYSWGVNGHGRQIYVLFRDGSYATYADAS